ncbi:MAG: transglutaminase-like domain-containing protein [Nanobdellota archaeon]
MKYLLIPLIVLLSMQATAEFYSSETLTMDLTISTDIQVLPRSPDYHLDNLIVNLSYVPQDSETQKIVSMSTNPKAKIQDGNAVYTITDISKKQPIDLKARVRATNHFQPLQDTIPFPLDTGMQDYLKPQETIDRNPEIVAQASKIVSGEDDLYSAVYLLGVWVRKNINYSLSSFTVEASKPASWVLENRYGVCDELTSLFIAMCRSVGIPARFVSGVAYTNYLDLNQWGPHAWAEVYFPEYGWIPFDVTYGQFGHLDSTHVALKRSHDAGDSSITYTWKGRDVDIDVSKLNVDTQLIKTGSPLKPVVDLAVEPLREEVGFGSYNLAKVTVKNTKPYYLIATIQFGQVHDINLLDAPMRFVLLKPHEEQDLYWRLKVKDDLDEDYIYTVPLLARTLRNQTAHNSFIAQENSPSYSYEQMEQLYSGLSFEEHSTEDKKIDLSCQPVGEVPLTGGNVTCSVKNTGNTYLSDIQVCLDSCETLNLGISQRKHISFALPMSVGAQEAIIKLEHPDLSDREIVSYRVYDDPAVEFVNVSVPDQIGYNEEFAVSVTVKKDSYTVPKNVRMSFHRKDGDQLSEMTTGRLNQTYKFRLRMKGKDLLSDNETFYAQIRYEGKNGTVYKKKVSYNVTLSDISWWQRFMLFLNRINSWVI